MNQGERGRIVASRRAAVPVSAARTLTSVLPRAQDLDLVEFPEVQDAPRRTNIPLPALTNYGANRSPIPVRRRRSDIPVGAALVAVLLPVFGRQRTEMQHAAAQPREIRRPRPRFARAEVLQHVVADHEVEGPRRCEARRPTRESSRASAQVIADLETGVPRPRQVPLQLRRASVRARNPRRGSTGRAIAVSHEGRDQVGAARACLLARRPCSGAP